MFILTSLSCNLPEYPWTGGVILVCHASLHFNELGELYYTHPIIPILCYDLGQFSTPSSQTHSTTQSAMNWGSSAQDLAKITPQTSMIWGSFSQHLVIFTPHPIFRPPSLFHFFTYTPSLKVSPIKHTILHNLPGCHAKRYHAWRSRLMPLQSARIRIMKVRTTHLDPSTPVNTYIPDEGHY